jgi:hypothetical protein
VRHLSKSLYNQLTTSNSKMIVKGIPNEVTSSVKAYRTSLTGITRLKDPATRGYNGRYWCCPGYTDRADGSIWQKKMALLQDAPRTDKKAPRAKVIPGLQNECMGINAPTKKVVGYKLNKKEVGHRVRGMFNTVRRCGETGKGYRNKKAVMYFFTVTFPVGTPAAVCYQLLNTWLTNLRQADLLRSYLWVSEKQKNGTTHFHVCVPHYLNVQTANKAMRKSIIFLIGKRQLNWSIESAKKYNGVDIAKDRKTRRVVNFADEKKERALSRYLTKYVSKNDDTHDRQPWHCSRDWAALVKGVHLTLPQLQQLCGGSTEQIRPGVFENEYVQFWGWKGRPPDKLRDHLADLNFSMVCHATGGTMDNIFSLKQ